MKKIIVSILLVCVLVMSLVACGGKKETEAPKPEESTAQTEGESKQTEGEAKKEFNVVYLSPSTESEYWQYGEVGIRNACLDLEESEGIKINFTVTGPATEAESDAYIKAFEGVIATEPDIIITATLAPDGTAPISKQAMEKGIVVNYVSMGLEGGDSNKYDDYYGVHYYCNNTVIGETAAKAMLEGLAAANIEPKGKIGMHMSVVVETLEERMNGFKDYMAEHAPEIECIDTLYNENDVQKAQSNCETQISTYGDELIGLYGGNNISGDGIALALAAANKGGKILGIGVDSDSVEIEALAAGNLYGIVVQTPYDQGYKALVNAYTYLTTGVNTETEKHIDCTSQIVTKENMDTDEAKALLNPKILAK